jgi:hypothetical protein
MGCFPSILRLWHPPTPTEGENPPAPPKPFDSGFQSCKSLSPESSIELKSPVISIEPPTSFKSPSPKEVEIIKAEKEPLDLPIEEINTEIATLSAAIRDYESLTASNRERIVADLNAILAIISENSLVYTKLEILKSQLNSLYREKLTVSEEYFQTACEQLPFLWKRFLGLSENEQRQQARTQPRSSPIMKIFTMLSNLRRVCDVQRELDVRIERKVGDQFEDILGHLRDLGSQEAALKWTVLGMVVSQRRKEGEGRVDEILGCRMRVSGLLVEVIGALSENEEWN